MHPRLFAVPALLMFVTAALAGCTTTTEEDVPPPEPPRQEPSFEDPSPADASGLEHVAQLAFADGTPYPSGSGIWAFGDKVYGSALGAGFFIADISDPESPTVLWNATTGQEDENDNTITGFSRDADVVVHSDGSITLVLATQSDGMHVWDVTDATAPSFLARVEVDPNHNIAVLPNTTLVFNSQSGGAGRTNDLVDLSQPAAPEVLGTFGTHGCHDITFWGTPGEEGARAYCAAIQRTEIWDLSGFDPTASDFGITLVSTVEGADSPVVGTISSYPFRTLHHLAIVDEDAGILIVGDEQNGGGSPGACFAYDETTGASTPFGALWFYDISDETDPQLVSWLSAPTEQPGSPSTGGDPTTTGLRDVPNCTGHFGTLVPGEDKIVMAWYSAGVLLVDFSDPSAPKFLDQFRPDGINTWDARVHGGYVFTGDITRGMDVLKIT